MIISMKKFSCLLTFSLERKLTQIQSSTKAGRRFDNLTHAQKVHAGKFHFRSASSMLKVPINKIGRPRSGSLICLITSMISDRIGRHEVLLPVNHNCNKICDTIGYFLNQNIRNSKFCFASSEKKKPFKRARDGAYCQLLRHDAYCPIKLSN